MAAEGAQIYEAKKSRPVCFTFETVQEQNQEARQEPDSLADTSSRTVHQPRISALYVYMRQRIDKIIIIKTIRLN